MKAGEGQTCAFPQAVDQLKLSFTLCDRMIYDSNLLISE